MKKKQEPHSLTEWPVSSSAAIEPAGQHHQSMTSYANKDGRQSVVSTASAQVFTKWLANKSKNQRAISSSEGSGGSSNNSPSLFPARLALALGMAKTLLGVLLVAFGALALWEHASMAYLGSGLWSGSVVLVCGLLGVMAGQRRRTSSVYVVSYLMVSVLALAAMGLLLIFTATGLARDTGAPLGFFVDLEEGERVDFLGTVPLRQRPIIINSVLIGLGVLSTIFSLAASVICLREACSCYAPNAYHRRLMNSNSSCNSSHNVHRLDSVPNINLLAADQSPEGQARAYRLMRWLRQSHEQSKQPRPPMLFRRLYNAPVPVAVPVVPGPPPPPPPHHLHHQAGFPSFVTGAPTAAYVIPAVFQPMIAAGPPAAFYSLASMPSLHSAGRSVGHSLPGPVQRPPTSLTQTTQQHRSSKPKKSKRTTGAESDEKAPRRRHQSCGTDEPMQSTQAPPTPPTDADSVASGYVFTGMDREIPEELILHSMTIRPPATSSTC